jgi:hypothetical protein
MSPQADGLFTRLRDPQGLLAGYLNRPAWDRLVERHKSGLEDATDRIWRLLNLQLWADIFLLGKDPWPAQEATPLLAAR